METFHRREDNSTVYKLSKKVFYSICMHITAPMSQHWFYNHPTLLCTRTDIAKMCVGGVGVCGCVCVCVCAA